MWSVKNLLEMCKIEKEILKHSTFHNMCSRNSKHSCCPTMSLPNYIAFFADLESCYNITDEVLNEVFTLLNFCSPYYCNGYLTPNCWNFKRPNSNCSKVPSKCTHYNAVYSVFHYLFSLRALCPFSPNFTLSHVAVFLPVHKRNSDLLSFYYAKFSSQPSDIISIYSVDFGINEEVFVDFLSWDSKYACLAMVLVGLVLFVYTRSLFVTIMSFLSTISAMLIAYFLYKIVLDFKFFPFMNLAAVLVIIGLSADSLLIFYSAWKESVELFSLKQVNCPPPRVGVIVKAAMNQVKWSLLVTSSTTAGAFLANYSSQVTAVKCFGVYVGLTVFANLLLSLSWIPACVVIHHKYLKQSLFCCELKLFLCSVLNRFTLAMKQYIFEILRIFFDQVQVLVVVHIKYFWVGLGFLITFASMYIVFIYPTISFPSGQTHFHYFQPSHFFERTKEIRFAFQNYSQPFMFLRFIFGVWPIDDGDPRNPFDTGNIEFQHHFNMSSPQSQVWLLNFCRKMRNSSFYSLSHQFQPRINCFIEGLISWIESRDCAIDALCCANQNFPYSSVVFELCLKKALFELSHTPGVYLHRTSPGPR